MKEHLLRSRTPVTVIMRTSSNTVILHNFMRDQDRNLFYREVWGTHWLVSLNFRSLTSTIVILRPSSVSHKLSSIPPPPPSYELRLSVGDLEVEVVARRPRQQRPATVCAVRVPLDDREELRVALLGHRSRRFVKDNVRRRSVLIFLRSGGHGAVGDAEGILVEVLLIRRGSDRVATPAI